MKRTFLLVLTALLLTGFLWAQTEILNETLRAGACPVGWSDNAITWQTGAGGYAWFTSIDAWLQTPILDLTDYENVQLIFDVAKYGSGDNGPLTVEISDDGGLSWTAQTFDSPTPTSSTYMTSGPTTITVSGDEVIIRWIRTNSPSAKRLRDVLLTGDLVITGLAITNIVQTPESDISSSTTVSVSADVNEGSAAIDFVRLQWGTTTGFYPNFITMSLDTRSGTYTTDTDIPVQTDGTTVYYVIYAEDVNEDSAFSSEQSYTVSDPATAILPYSETFDTDLGDTYNFTVSGSNPWYHWTSSATANAHEGDFPEEHWLVLPAINFNDYTDVIMTFTNYARFGDIDADNYLKLFYSTNYEGIGNPYETGVTWSELAFNQPASGPVGSTEIETASGILDLSAVSGDSVNLAFKYYSNGLPTRWRVDDINIYEALNPFLTVFPTSLSGFSYPEGTGPSASQNYTLSGVNLDPADDEITVSGNLYFEVSTDDTNFYPSVQVPYTGDELTATTIYVRLKEDLLEGTYDSQDITNTGGSDSKTVTVSGSVTPPPLPGYFVDFEGTGETKASYASGTINLSGLNWDMTEAMTSNPAHSDWYNDTTSARLRGYEASAMTMLENKPNGIGTVSFYYRRYGGDPQVDWKVEYSVNNGDTWVQIGTDFTAPATDDVQQFSETVDVAGNVRIRILRATADGNTSSNRRLNIDDIQITDYIVANMVATPTFDPPAGSYEIPPTVEIETTTDGATVRYSFDSETGPWTDYTTGLLITETTTIWAYALKAEMTDSPVTSATYTLLEPATTTLPYEETFDTDLGDCYDYTVTGSNPWHHTSGSARCNGFNGEATEEHWLILPGINFNDYTDVEMSFTNYAQYGTIDANNYLKLYYSTNYQGLGDPYAAGVVWNELAFNQPPAGAVGSIQIETSSGILDLSAILADSVFLAFKYYSTDSPTSWRVDDISIFEATAPILTVNPEVLSGFMYVLGSGPSTSQSFEVSGTNLDNTDVTITAPTDFEVSIDNITFSSGLTLTAFDGAATDIWVQLTDALAVGDYSGNVSISGGGAAGKTVNVSGEVVPSPAGLPYFEDFAGFVSFETLPDDWSVTNETYGGDWGTGTSGGLRGNASVLGFQHTSGTGIFTATLTLLNDTGSTIEDLYISYLGMVERIGETRVPEWTVKLNETEIPELFYSTASGVDETKSVLLQGLNIENNEIFTISWSSDRGESLGSSKQIGIGEVTVDTEEPTNALLETDTPSLTGLNYFLGFGPSDAQSFELTGVFLDGSDVTVTAPSQFRVSEDNITFTENITLTSYDGSPSVIWVHLIAALPAGEYSGDVTISGGGAAQIAVAVSGSVITELDIPYSNPFRTQSDIDTAILQGFTIADAQNETGTGGYLRISPNGYLETPTIDFTEHDNIEIGFDATTYGGDLGQTLTIFVSSDDGVSYDAVDTYLLTGTYLTYTKPLDLTDTLNVATGRIKIEMTAGGGSSRFRDFSLDADYYTSVEGLAGMALWSGLTDIVSADHIDYSYDAARYNMHAFIDNVDDQVRCIYTGQWVAHPEGTMSTPTDFSAEHTYAQSWYEADLSPEAISYAVSDLHTLHPARIDANQSRSNHPFDYITDILSIWGSESYLSYLGDNTDIERAFDVADEFKGNLARGILYFSVRYYSDNYHFSRGAVDQLPTLIQWHLEDPVDAREIERNELVYGYQGNRNPFIDRPEFVELIWGELALDAPLATAASSITEDSFVANWDGVTGAVSYRLDVSTSPIFAGFVDGFKNIVVSGTNHIVAGLDSDTNYFYRVRAVATDGTLSLNSNTINVTSSSDGVLLHYWNFNIENLDVDGNWVQPIPADEGTGEIAYTFTEAISYGGTTINGVPGEVSGQSFVPRPDTGLVNNGEYFELSLPTTGHQDIIFSYATQATTSGFMSQEILYSTNGTDFTTLETFTVTAAFSWLARSVDFSAIPGVDNNPDFKIRIILDGGTQSTGNNRFDNIRVMGIESTIVDLDPPANVEIQISGDNVIITWDSVTGANSYLVEASDDPYNEEGYTDVTGDGIFTGNEEWTGTVTGDKKFYRVRASATAPVLRRR
jgi:hypothetical protein